MEVSVSDAEARLTDLVRRAERGEDVVLTREGQPVVRLVPAGSRPTQVERAAALREAMNAGPRLATAGPCAARSQDFLYSADGLPR